MTGLADLTDLPAAQDNVLGSIDVTDAQGMTALMKAACFGSAGLVRALIEGGARIDLASIDGNQPLWFACVSDDPEMIGLILAAGAAIDHVNATGATALMYAASAGKERALAALLAAGADLTIEMGGLTALDMAATLPCLALLRKAAGKPLRHG